MIETGSKFLTYIPFYREGYALRPCQLRPSRLILLYIWDVFTSRVFRDKNKDLVNLEIVSADKVWNKKNNKYVLDNKNYGIYGKVEKGTSAFVCTTNLDGSHSKFIEDTSRLSKKTKNS